MAHTSLKLPDTQKERWTEFIGDNPEPDSLSHLIRLGVESYIAGSDEDKQSGSTSMDTETSGEILNALTQIDNKVTDLQERVGAVERETSTEATYDLRRVVYELLPEGEPQSVGDGTTPAEIARRIGAEPEDVTDAFETLEGEVAGVSSVTSAPPDGSEPRTVYYRRPDR